MALQVLCQSYDVALGCVVRQVFRSFLQVGGEAAATPEWEPVKQLWSKTPEKSDCTAVQQATLQMPSGLPGQRLDLQIGAKRQECAIVLSSL